MPLFARVLIAFVGSVVPEPDRQSLRGDLEELYFERSRTSGHLHSAFWLLGQVAHASIRYAPQRTALAFKGGMRGLLGWCRLAGLSTRQIRTAPAFAATVVALIALGVGANVTVFSLVDGILLTPLPYSEPERIVSVSEDNPEIRISAGWTSIPNYLDWREQLSAFDAMAMFRGRSVSVGTDGDPVYAYGARVTADFFAVFGQQPTMGRPFTVDETTLERAPVVILSHGLWMQGYGGDPGILGRAILVDGSPHLVVGVMPEGFNAPGEWIGAGLNVALWRPFALDSNDERDNRSYSAVGRLAAGTNLAAARLEVDGVHQKLREAFPDANGAWRAQVLDWTDLVLGRARAPLALLLGTMLLVLAIACANVVSLTTTRILGRTRELATRIALGAARANIVAQVLVETLWLIGLGGIVGLVGGRFGLIAVKALLPTGVPRLNDIQLDGSVLVFGLAITAVATVGVGVVAAPLATRQDPAQQLRGSSVGPSRVGWRIRGSLAVVQLVASFALLASATLLSTSFWNQQRTDLGFESEGVTAVTVALSWDRVGTQDARTAFTRDLLGELGQIPGVESVGMINSLPLSGSRQVTRVDIDGRTDENRGPALAIRGISPGYDQTMRIPIVEGRSFQSADVSTPTSALVNEAAARHHWPDGTPLGERVRIGSGRWLTVVGVLENVLHDGAREDVLPELYIPYPLETLTSKSFVIRTSGQTGPLAPQVRDALRRVDAQQPIREIRSMDEWVDRVTAVARFQAILMGAAAALATLLAGIGVFAALASVVRERRREIAVRLALGAQRRGVLEVVSGKALALLVPGVAGGVAVALMLNRLLTSYLYGVEPQSPYMFALVVGALSLTALVAASIPASRAISLDPATVLRDE